MKPRSRQKPKTAQPSSTANLGDQALAKNKHLKTIDDGASLPIQLGRAEVSPYIVRLTSSGQEPRAFAATTDELKALADSFVIDYDDQPDEAPLCFAEDAGQGLRLQREEVQAQLREPERVIALKIVPLAPPPPSVVSASGQPGLDDLLIEETIDISPLPAMPLPPPPPGYSLAVAAVEADPIPALVVEQVEPVVAVKRARVFAPGVWQQSWLRGAVAFAVLCSIVSFPLHALRVVASTENVGSTAEDASRAALGEFMRGATSLQGESYSTAGGDFAAAAKGFASAEASLDDLHAAVAGLINVIPSTDRTYTTARALVTAGKEFSETASLMSQGVADLDNHPSFDVATKVDLLAAYASQALPHARLASAALRDVDPELIPADVGDNADLLLSTAPKLVASLEEFVRFAHVLTVLLGHEQQMRYLVLFQNNTELRPTGGFVGSFAQLDVDGGNIVDMNVPGGGTYDLQGQLTAFVAAPGPLQLLKARWELQDANWFPDFPTSARKFQWFYGQAGGPTTDGVISVNATFVADLLAILGPVDLPGYDRTFTAENFIFELQKIVELEYDKKENAPKAVVGQLAPILLERLTEADTPTLLAVLEKMGEGLRNKDIMLFFNDNDLQATVQSLGWTGEIKETSGDYLLVANTNIGGGKTDGIIDQNVDLKIAVADDGSIEHTLTVTKTHRGMKNTVFTGVNNVDYLRVYVPQGSEFVSAKGFEIPDEELFETPEVPLNLDEDLALEMRNVRKDNATGTDIWDEAGKTVFGNWMQTAPGETQVVVITYRTPLSLAAEQPTLAQSAAGRLGLSTNTEPYSIFVQKQPGVISRNTHVELTLPSDLVSSWTSFHAANSLAVDIDNSHDAFLGWILERR